MTQKPSSHRKTVSSFINDQSSVNPIQVSPRTAVVNWQQRGPFTMNSPHSKTNFIGETLIPSEGSRAFAVTGTGEKHYIPLVEEVGQFTNKNPFTLQSDSSTAISPKNTSQSRLQHKGSGGDSTASPVREKNIKLLKKSKPTRRHASQRARLTFTPRSNADRVNTAYLLPNESQTVMQAGPPSRSTKNTSVQTQTDAQHIRTCLPCTTCVPQFHSTPASLYGTQRNLSSSMITPRLHRQLLQTSQQTPKKIYSMTDSKQKYFSEFRNITSVLTLITVFFWLLSTCYGRQFFSDLLVTIVQRIRSWNSTEEIPKNKVELVVQYLANLWS